VQPTQPYAISHWRFISGTQNIGGYVGMLGLMANFMGDLGKQLIAVGVARSRSKALQILLWPWPRVWLDRFYLHIFEHQKPDQKTQAFANGGIVVVVLW
jgi:hypothetical protein